MSVSGIRLTLSDNRDPSEAKIVLFNPATGTLDALLRLASEKFLVKAKKLFLSDGGEVEDVNVLRDNDVVYVSAGEAFHKSVKEDSCKLYSIAVMGPGAVGKSAMTLQYVQGLFVPDYDPTIEDAYRKNINVDGEACMLDILDTAGQEDYIALRSTWMRSRDGFVLVFSVCDRATFDGLESFYDQMCVMHEERVPPLIVVGNKCDLVEDREVAVDEGKKLAAQWKATYLETSAKTGQNIELVFSTLAREVRKAGGSAKAGTKKDSKRWCTIL